MPIIEKLFEMIDKDKDGTVSFEELKAAFETHSFYFIEDGR